MLNEQVTPLQMIPLETCLGQYNVEFIYYILLQEKALIFIIFIFKKFKFIELHKYFFNFFRVKIHRSMKKIS